jgi:hypothetical protein
VIYTFAAGKETMTEKDVFGKAVLLCSKAMRGCFPDDAFVLLLGACAMSTKEKETSIGNAMLSNAMLFGEGILTISEENLAKSEWRCRTIICANVLLSATHSIPRKG